VRRRGRKRFRWPSMTPPGSFAGSRRVGRVRAGGSWSARSAVKTTSDRRRRSSCNAAVRALPLPDLLAHVDLPRSTPRAWVTAIMCRAQFIARLPPRLSRTLPAVAQGPRRHRCGAGEPGEGALVPEPMHAGGLTDDGGREVDLTRDRTAACTPGCSTWSPAAPGPPMRPGRRPRPTAS
jgi:hypothetical protein